MKYLAILFAVGGSGETLTISREVSYLCDKDEVVEYLMRQAGLTDKDEVDTILLVRTGVNGIPEVVKHLSGRNGDF